jgi:riboflavin kinase/FMN adenylyltransferase
MLNLGPRPTFGDEQVIIEVHLFGQPGDLYGSRVRLDFISRLRDTLRFDGVEALVTQLSQDAINARIALAATD